MRRHYLFVSLMIICLLLCHKQVLPANVFPVDKSDYDAQDRLTVYVSDDHDDETIQHMYYSILYRSNNKINIVIYKMIEENDESSLNFKYRWDNTCDIATNTAVDDALIIRSNVNKNERIIIYDIIDGPHRMPIMQIVYDMEKDGCSKAVFNNDTGANTNTLLFPLDAQTQRIMDRAIIQMENNGEERIYYSTLYVSDDSLKLNVYKKAKDNEKIEDRLDAWNLVCMHTSQWTQSQILIMSPRVVSGNVINMGIYSTLFAGESHYMWFDYMNDKCADDFEPDFYD